jgi:predicted RNase H-like HicB family nuclease
MTCDIWIKPIESGFVATVLGLPGCFVEAATREEVIEKARKEILNWLAAGEVVRLEIEEPPQAQKFGVGIFADESDESWNQFLSLMKEYRRQVDADPKQDRQNGFADCSNCSRARRHAGHT